MAGEVEESFSIGFQTESVHSGSISFGRFENEPLAWERRSAFQHNRYLEEVEKFSKPGSVIEKKAYFEAHFVKKGLLPINVTGSHYICNYQAGENGASDKIVDTETTEQIEDVHYTQFDNHPETSDFQLEYEVTEYENDNIINEGLGESISNSYMETNLYNSSVLVDGIANNNCPEEIHELQNQTGNPLMVNEETDINFGKTFDVEVNSVEVLKAIDPISVFEAAAESEKSITENHSSSLPKLSKPLEEKTTVTHPVEDDVQVKKGNHNLLSKEHLRRISRKTFEIPMKRNVEKRLSKVANPTMPVRRETPKSVDYGTEEKQTRDVRRGEKASRTPKATECQPLIMRVDSRRVKAAERHTRAVNSTKSDSKQTTITFNFRSSGRAEKRKEFHQKLEEKMHAKEEEMNQMQAISQEKTEAKIRRLRKSLNFKATPMPSFYNAPAHPTSTNNKVVRSDLKARIEIFNNGSPKRAADVVLRSNPNPSQDRTLSVSESAETTDDTLKKWEADCSKSETSTADSVPNHRNARNKVQKYVNPQKMKVSENCKVAKNQNYEMKQKQKSHRISDEMAKNRNVGVRSNSKMSCVSVHVSRP